MATQEEDRARGYIVEVEFASGEYRDEGPFLTKADALARFHHLVDQAGDKPIVEMAIWSYEDRSPTNPDGTIVAAYQHTSPGHLTLVPPSEGAST